MSLYKRGRTYWYRFRSNGQQYRGSCKTPKLSEARKVESLVFAQLIEHNTPPGSQKIPNLSEFSKRFFEWLDSLPTDRPPKLGTRKYYHVGWKLLERTTIAARRLDHIECQHVAALVVGSSPANTNNALRTLRRMLKQAQEWRLLHTIPKIQLVEEQGREMMLEPWMEVKLLAVTQIARASNKKNSPKSANYGWHPLRDVLLVMLDTGMRPAEVFRMEWEHVHWESGSIFVPRSKSRKSKRYVPLSDRVRAALEQRQKDSRFVFPSDRSRSGHIETVQKQFARAKQLADLPDPIVLYCARHRFSTDAMEATNNVMAVMDVMGHSKIDVTRVYQHPGLKQIGIAINQRNQAVSEHKTEHSVEIAVVGREAVSN